MNNWDINKGMVKNVQSQRGATLLVSLIILVLLTFVGLASIDVTTVDVKIATNSKDRQMAFNDADDSLFEAGDVIDSVTECISAADGIAQYVSDTFQSGSDPNGWWSDIDNWTLATRNDSEFVIEAPIKPNDTGINIDTAENKVNSLGVSNVPISDSTKVYYPVTARAHGPGGSPVVLESDFVKYTTDVNLCD